MADRHATLTPREPGDSNLGTTYAAVMVVEVIVLLALWAFSTYFG